jgi:copper chaperone CopZ
MTSAVTLAIEGMHCGACVKRVRAALEKVPGVAIGLVAIGTATVTLEGATEDDVITALAKAGYPARTAAS